MKKKRDEERQHDEGEKEEEKVEETRRSRKRRRRERRRMTDLDAYSESHLFREQLNINVGYIKCVRACIHNQNFK